MDVMFKDWERNLGSVASLEIKPVILRDWLMVLNVKDILSSTFVILMGWDINLLITAVMTFVVISASRFSDCVIGLKMV